MKKGIISIFLFIFSHFVLLAQNRNVFFYGPISSSKDVATTKLTSDLFYSQLESLPGYNLIDKRDLTFQENYISDISEENTLLFYTEIQEDGTNWVCTLRLIDSITKQSHSKTTTYDGYYRILMEAKNSLLELLNEFSLVYNSTPTTENTTHNQNISSLTLDSISGTWQGDTLISKIVILRGGRGFVIYKNGASMNISVSIKDNTVIAEQTSRSNASFFPDLPREIALVVASTAEPIKWTLSLVDDNTLSGEKITLMPSGNEATLQSVAVTWKKTQSN